MITKEILISELQTMLRDKWGYIWGTAGKRWTQADQDSATDDSAIKYGSKWVGHMVADCSGVMVYIWKKYGMSIYHGSNTIARQYCGALTTVPHAGYACFKWKEPTPAKFSDGKGDFYHMGVVGEDEKTVYESRSTSAGFVHDSDVSKWQYFAPFKDVNYSSAPTQYNAVITGNNVRIRSGAGTDYQIIGHCNKGDRCKVLASVDGWCYCEGLERNGYVSAQYVRQDEPTPTPAPAQDVTTLVSATGQTIQLIGKWSVRG